MTYKYNPLLKDNLQKSDTAEIEQIEESLSTAQADIANLKANKVSKCVNTEQLNDIEIDEIFQWQGTTNDNFVNGYFYKKTVNTVVVVERNNNYIYIPPEDSQNFDGHRLESGYYAFVEHTSNTYTGLSVGKANNKYYSTWKPAVVGQQVIKSNYTILQTAQLGFIEYVTVAEVDEYDRPSKYSDGATYSMSSEGRGTGSFDKYRNAQGVIINCAVVTQGSGSGIIFITDSENYPINLYCNYARQIAQSDITIEEIVYQQINTQPQISDIEPSENGLDVDTNLNVSGNVAVSGDLTVNGTQTVVITQEIDSENDNINLRYNNPLGLENGAESGVKVLNYDGNNTNCFLGVDNQGWARVGDENGTLQKLATIEENPTNGELVAYNTTTKQLESKTLSVTSTTAAGLCPQLPNDSTTTKYLREDGTWVKPPNTTYSSKTAASGGTDVSLCTTGEKYTWNNKSDLAIGTSASTAAAGNHTHSLSIATDSGTNQLTLAASTKYKLTAGGKTFIFTTPANGSPTVTSGSSSLSGGGYAWAKFGNVATLKLSAGVAAGTYTLPSGVPKPNSLINTITNGAKIKLTTTQLIVTSGYQADECITYICQ